MNRLLPFQTDCAVAIVAAANIAVQTPPVTLTKPATAENAPPSPDEEKSVRKKDGITGKVAGLDVTKDKDGDGVSDQLDQEQLSELLLAF